MKPDSPWLDPWREQLRPTKRVVAGQRSVHTRMIWRKFVSIFAVYTRCDLQSFGPALIPSSSPVAPAQYSSTADPAATLRERGAGLLFAPSQDMTCARVSVHRYCCEDEWLYVLISKLRRKDGIWALRRAVVIAISSCQYLRRDDGLAAVCYADRSLWVALGVGPKD